MLQHFKGSLGKFHDLLMGERCAAWALEELMVAAIKSDTHAQHQVRWKEAGHDDKADIIISVNGATHTIQVKSGKVTRTHLTLSGHRLGRFGGNLAAITEYLNAPKANFVSVPCRRKDGEQGRQYIYWFCYIDKAKFTGIAPDGWVKRGKQYRQTNTHGIEFSLRPTMSWQIWWKIPLKITEQTEPIVIG